MLLAALLGALIGGAGIGAPPAAAADKGLTAFRSDAELRRYLRRLRVSAPVPVPVPMMAPPPAPMPMPVTESPPPAAAAEAAVEMDSDVENVVVTGSQPANPSITNTQEADVDEGGIVKVRGDLLVILRRGRLFTVSIAGAGMRPVDSINAYPPGVDAAGDWYDEMLISGDRVVVIGYSYSRGGTEINRFRIAPDGRLRFEDAYHLTSNDYYSSRNYASRLIGDELILYSPLGLEWDEDPLEALPGLRRWRGDEDRPFQRIARARQIYIPRVIRNDREAEIDTLHTVTRCNLTAPTLNCSAVGVLGTESRTFYVSGRAVYVWISNVWGWSNEEERRASSFVVRMPLQEGRPTAVQARGAPVDQFSFREDRADDVLNVLVRSEGGGDEMWRPEFSRGAVALLRLPIGVFGDGSAEARLSRYRPLPRPSGYQFENRFVGDHLLYAFDAPAPASGGGVMVATPVRGGPVTTLSLPHDVSRIEVLGRDALAVGTREADLFMTTVELSPGIPQVGDRYIYTAASEAESRSHGFFYRPDAGRPDSGLLGLPVARARRPMVNQLFENSAAIVFLRRQERRLAPLGELVANPDTAVDDDCEASCADWYGNARPIFLAGRVFALMGYELVEGAPSGNGLREIGRVDFSPPPEPQRRR